MSQQHPGPTYMLHLGHLSRLLGRRRHPQRQLHVGLDGNSVAPCRFVSGRGTVLSLAADIVDAADACGNALLHI